MTTELAKTVEEKLNFFLSFGSKLKCHTSHKGNLLIVHFDTTKADDKEFTEDTILFEKNKIYVFKQKWDIDKVQLDVNEIISQALK